MAEKRCPTCKTTQPADRFSKDRSRGDGLQAACKECEAQFGRSYRERNVERRRARSRAYYLSRRDEILARGRERYAADPEKKLASNKVWAKANRPRLSEASGRWRARRRNAPVVEKIDRLYVYERDRGICHICRRKVSARGFTLDHLVPLSKGGNHTHDNLAVAHLRCNSRRCDGRIPAQLLLVG